MLKQSQDAIARARDKRSTCSRLGNRARLSRSLVSITTRKGTRLRALSSVSLSSLVGAALRGMSSSIGWRGASRSDNLLYRRTASRGLAVALTTAGRRPREPTPFDPRLNLERCLDPERLQKQFAPRLARNLHGLARDFYYLLAQARALGIVAPWRGNTFIEDGRVTFRCCARLRRQKARSAGR